MMLIAAVLLVASLVGAYFGTVTSQSDEAAVIGIPWNSVLAMFIAHFMVLLSSHAMPYSYAAISGIVGLCRALSYPKQAFFIHCKPFNPLRPCHTILQVILYPLHLSFCT